MKKLLAVIALAVSFGAGAVLSAQVRDWRDVRDVRHRIDVCLNDLQRLRAVNNYDMGGHGIKAEQHLQAAERELDMAIRTAAR